MRWRPVPGFPRARYEHGLRDRLTLVRSDRSYLNSSILLGTNGSDPRRQHWRYPRAPAGIAAALRRAARTTVRGLSDNHRSVASFSRDQPYWKSFIPQPVAVLRDASSPALRQMTEQGARIGREIWSRR